jgi:hypothetical protein
MDIKIDTTGLEDFKDIKVMGILGGYWALVSPKLRMK